MGLGGGVQGAPMTNCLGGERCRTCSDNTCATIYMEMRKNLSLVMEGKLKPEEVFADMNERFPTKAGKPIQEPF